MCFLDKCTYFQAFLSPQPAIPPSMFHASFYSNAYNRVPCTQTTAKYPLWGNEEQNNMWCCLEQNAIKMITAPAFLHSFIHWYSLTISTYIPLQYLHVKERKKCHRSLRQKCSFGADEERTKKQRRGCTSKYLFRCWVSWVLLPHSAVWESHTGGRVAGQPRSPLTCNGIPCSALGQDTAQPCRALHQTGMCTCAFHMELMPLVLPTGSLGWGTCSGRLQQEVRIHASSLADHSPCTRSLSIFVGRIQPALIHT